MATKRTAKKTPPPTHTAPVTAPSSAAKKAAVKKTTVKAAPTPVVKASPDVIARAAYLNYRRRIEQGLPGDSHADWLEAERYFSGKNES